MVQDFLSQTADRVSNEHITEENFPLEGINCVAKRYNKQVLHSQILEILLRPELEVHYFFSVCLKLRVQFPS